MFCAIAQTPRGMLQAVEAGKKIKGIMETSGKPYKLYFYMSPYRRSSQTAEGVASQFSEAQIAGFQEEVQLREQDFGNFQVKNAFVISCVLQQIYHLFLFYANIVVSLLE